MAYKLTDNPLWNLILISPNPDYIPTYKELELLGFKNKKSIKEFFLDILKYNPQKLNEIKRDAYEEPSSTWDLFNYYFNDVIMYDDEYNHWEKWKSRDATDTINWLKFLLKLPNKDFNKQKLIDILEEEEWDGKDIEDILEEIEAEKLDEDIKQRKEVLQELSKQPDQQFHKLKGESNILENIARQSYMFGLIKGKKVRLHWNQGKRKFYFLK